MHLLTAYRDRLRARPDSEHSQALLRIAIVVAIFGNTAWVTAHGTDSGWLLWGINLLSTAFSVLVLARILKRPAASPRRRVLAAVHDNVAATIWLYTSGPIGALALFVFPFVTVGNGFRFGVRYLAVSGLLGAVGIGTLVFAAPGWAGYGMIGGGVLLSHVVVMLYTGVLLARLRETQVQLAALATRDALTGLPNRRHFTDRLADVITAGERSIACLYLDLDGFKAVNDRCGHDAGDELLNRVAEAIRGCIRTSDTLARLGGDEFAVLVDVPRGVDDARLVAERIIRAVGEVTSVGGHRVDISVSVGIAFVPTRALERRAATEELLRAADQAMYAAKRSGGGGYRFAERPALAAAA
jgi:diguanylate cyclase (GGDEF)-like protein